MFTYIFYIDIYFKIHSNVEHSKRLIRIFNRIGLMFLGGQIKRYYIKYG